MFPPQKAVNEAKNFRYKFRLKTETTICDLRLLSPFYNFFRIYQKIDNNFIIRIKLNKKLWNYFGISMYLK